VSVAKPVLEYAKTIKTQAELTRSVKAFKRLLTYHKPDVHIIIFISVLCILRSYLSALEPLYTSQIIDQVITAGQHELLLDLVLKILFSVLGVGVLNFVVAYIHDYFAQMMRDIRSDYHSSLQSKSFKFYDSTAVGDLVLGSAMEDIIGITGSRTARTAIMHITRFAMVMAPFFFNFLILVLRSCRLSFTL
jgi:ABC-type bacteriocin/lantibiotic exporter with double-glycine peptidase domain